MTTRWFASVALAGTVLLAGCASSNSHHPRAVPHDTAPPASSPPHRPSDNPYARLILRDGDTVRASGRVVAVPGRHVRFCAPLPVTEVDLTIRYCDDGVDVDGVDLSRLTRRENQHGAIRGAAQLTGVYRAGTLRVTAQGPPVSHSGIGGIYGDPPCPAPPGGWPGPTPGNGGNLDDRPVAAYRHAHPGTIMEIALSRPSAHEVLMLVLAVGRPAPIRRALRDDYPNQLCVIHSRYTKADVHAAYHALMLDTPDGLAAGSWSIGQGLTPRSQVDVEVELRQVTPAVAADATRQAPGLVRLKPWLGPRR